MADANWFFSNWISEYLVPISTVIPHYITFVPMNQGKWIVNKRLNV
jgi:hypothetical protein